MRVYTYIVVLKMTAAAKEEGRQDEKRQRPEDSHCSAVWAIRFRVDSHFVHPSHLPPVGLPPSSTIIRPSELGRVCTLSVHVRKRVLS